MEELSLTNKKKSMLLMAVSLFLGAFIMVAIRFVTITSDETHYHANFAVFVEGDRVPFDRFTFYEEVASCSSDNAFNPKIRTHMHEMENHIIHVHDEGSTWGHFFANLGFTNGDTVFKTDEEVYIEGEELEITFILNGEEVDTTANRTIRSEDVLLVSIGEADEGALQAQYAEIPQDAAIYNEQDDPANCSGGKSLTVTERLKIALGF